MSICQVTFSFRRARNWVVLLALFVVASGSLLVLHQPAAMRAAAPDKPSPRARQPVALDRHVRSVLQKHCLQCHGPEKQRGGLRLDTLTPDFADKDRVKTWETVLKRVLAGEMPPKRRPRPTADEVNVLTGWIAGQLRAARQVAGGRVPLRRLNRVEYENTLRDLLALPHLDVKQVLPPDDSAFGFDNVASAQNISYVQMARYLDAANLALDRAMCLGEKPQRRTQRMVFQQQGRFRGKFGKGRGETRHIKEWVVFLRQPNSAQTPWRVNNRKPFKAGYYTFRIRCRGVVFDHGKLLPQDRNHVVSVYTREKRLLKTLDVPAEAQVLEFTAWLYDNDMLEFFCASLDDRNTPGAGKFRPYKGPGIAVEYLEVEGPSLEAWPRESHRRLFGNLPVVEWTPESGLKEPALLTGKDHPRGNKRFKRRGKKKRKGPLWMVESRAPLKDAETLLRKFMARAYRRPVDEAEFKRCFRFAQQGIQARLCFQDAMRLAYKAALCSPDFLFFHEKPGKLDGYALASRLSYFLWRSMPDDTLVSLAKSGELGKPAVLRAQVERMLKDPRVNRFVADFTGQWLDLRKVHDTAPDRHLYPEYFCDNHLVESAVREGEAYFAEMLKEDLPATAVVASNFVMINERLAKVYDIPGVKGSAIRKAVLPKGSPRGGFITQAGVLKVTANGLTTSPVLRGVWMLDRILGQPSPPPPPDAGAIDPDTRGATTVREQLAKHRRDPSCASCHVKIDPPGFALESFDVMGAWRDHYRSFQKGEQVKRKVADRPVRYKRGPRVDPTGELASGEKFRDVTEFRKLLLNHPDPLARNLIIRLLTFATGAGVGPVDMPVVEDILRQTKKSQHGLRSIIHAVVQSELFQTK